MRRLMPHPYKLPAIAEYAELYPPPYDFATRHIRPVVGTKGGALQVDIEAEAAWNPGSSWSALRKAAEAVCSPKRELVLMT